MMRGKATVGLVCSGSKRKIFLERGDEVAEVSCLVEEKERRGGVGFVRRKKVN